MLHSLVIVELSQTCNAFPAQWKGTLEDGRPTYIRYRHGKLSVDAGADSLFERQVGEHSAGEITLAEVLDHTGLSLAPGLR